MGNRANFYTHNGIESGIYIYTHWNGDELPAILRKTLVENKNLWDDEQYFNGVLFNNLYQQDKSSGFSAAIGDGDDRILDIDFSNQLIIFSESYNIKNQSFSEFIEVTNNEHN